MLCTLLKFNDKDNSSTHRHVMLKIRCTQGRIQDLGRGFVESIVVFQLGPGPIGRSPAGERSGMNTPDDSDLQN